MSNKIFYIDHYRENTNTAGSKAPDDIAQLCMIKGYQRLEEPKYPVKSNWFRKKIWCFTTYYFWWKHLSNTLSNGDVVIYQHPSYGKFTTQRMVRKYQKKLGCKFVAVIHDLESLRGGISGIVKSNSKFNKHRDETLLKVFDGVICHNDRMKNYLQSQGLNNNIVCLNIFDYLCDYNPTLHEKNEPPIIVIAGNLAKAKSGYIYELCGNESNNGFKVNLYGKNFDSECVNTHCNWIGCYTPDDLPKHLQGDFGLVWDGPSIESCVGNTGEYLKFNNPHKASLYLAAGIPVIVWKESALSDFVLTNNVGIAISSLKDIGERIHNIKEDDYKLMVRNAIDVGNKIRNGFFFNRAFDEVIKSI